MSIATLSKVAVPDPLPKYLLLCKEAVADPTWEQSTVATMHSMY